MNSKSNLADKASRGLSTGALLDHNHWITGQEFLSYVEGIWPKLPGNMIVEADDPEV